MSRIKTSRKPKRKPLSEFVSRVAKVKSLLQNHSPAADCGDAGCGGFMRSLMPIEIELGGTKLPALLESFADQAVCG